MATALIRSLQSHGLQPTAAVGHGVGAVAAACAAGAVTIADGLDLAAGTARSAFVAASEPGYALFVAPGGASLTGQQARDPGYWKAVLEEPADGWVAGQVAGLDLAAWLEIGTSATLHLPSAAAPSVPADPYAQLLHTVGVLWEIGICGPRDRSTTGAEGASRPHIPIRGDPALCRGPGAGNLGKAELMQETQTETALAGLQRLWMEVLGVDAVDEDDNFLELGGHSLSAIRLSTLIREELNLTVPFAEILQNTVYADLREVIRRAPSESDDAEVKTAEGRS